MYDWYQNENNKIEIELIEQKSYSEIRIYEIMLFARIENALYDMEMKKLKMLSSEILKLRNPDTDNVSSYYYIYEEPLEKYIRRCEEYSELIVSLNRPLNQNDIEYFSDGANMFRWYEREYKKYKEEEENKTELSEERKSQRKFFIKIINKIGAYSYSMSFQQKTKDYIEKIIMLKRNINAEDKFYFENTTKDMYSWFIYYDQKLNHERDNIEKPSGERLEKLICFAKIYDELYKQKKLKLSIK